ncbi:MAG: hypothetical protein ACFCVK_12385 [Acidimicrobiales bacterium]
MTMFLHWPAMKLVERDPALSRVARLIGRASLVFDTNLVRERPW